MQKATRSFLPKSILVITLGLITALGYQAAAVDVVTDPVGFITLNITAGPAKRSYLGLGMTQIVTNLGLTGTAVGTKVPVSATLTAGAFNRIIAAPQTNFAYFIEITSGPNAGLMDDIVSNDTANVFTASDDSALSISAQTYKIRPHWTLGNLFGTNNTAGFTPGTTDLDADNITVFDTALQSPAIYYFKTNTAAGGTGWRKFGTPTLNRANTQLYIDEGLVVLRRPATGTNVLLVGAVKLGPTITPIVAGLNKRTHVGNVYPASFSLNSSGLYTTNSATGVQPGTTDLDADNVSVWNPTTQSPAIYYFKTNTAAGGTGWRRFGAPTVQAGTSNLLMGANTVILRRPATPFNWFVPQPFTQ